MRVKNEQLNGDDIYDHKLEGQVIGILLVNSAIHTEIIPMLCKFDFTHPTYEKAFIAMLSLFEKKIKCELVSVSRELKHLGLVASMYELTEVSGKVASSTNIKTYALQLIELRIRRSLIGLSQRTIILARDERIFALKTAEDTLRSLRKIINLSVKNPVLEMKNLYQNTVKDIETADNDILISDFSLRSVSEAVVGMLAGNNTIIAARPGVGKTAFVMQELWHASLTVPVGVVSIEQTATEIMHRLISTATGIPVSRLIRKRDLSATEKTIIASLTDHFNKRFYVIEDAYELSAIRNGLMKLIEVYGVMVWGLDYIQLVKHTSVNKTKNYAVEEVSAELKYISKTTLTHGLVLSQLSRDSEKGSEMRKPRLSDLRDSGAIEQDATTVMLLYRPEAQGATESKKGDSLKGKALIIIAKNRNGAPGIEVLTNFNGERYQFTEEESQQLQLEIEQDPY